MASGARKRIVVLGTGYVGLPAAILLARAGYEVVGVDIDENVVRAINEGILHIREEQLESIMAEPVVRANLKAQNRPIEGDVFLIAVPTPIDHRKKVAEMKYVRDAVLSIVPFLRPGNLVILESTVPPLTCRNFMTPILERSGLKVGENLFLAHCPERILPGDVFQEIVNNDRIIGAADPTSRALAKEVYSAFVKGNLFETNDITAELCKLMENTFRDVNVALANELASVAEGLGIDPIEAIDLANKHPRVNLLQPGIGVGGHCIPLDPWFIKEVDPANSRLIFTARQINEEQPLKIAGKIRKAVRGIQDPRLVLIGATYKPNTDDLRESPAIEIAQLMRDDGYQVTHYDPLVADMRYSSIADAVRGADCLVVLVEHTVVRRELEENRSAIEEKMRTPIVLRFYQRAAVPAVSAVTSVV